MELLKKKKEAVPEVEWWDVPFVGQEGYSRVDEGTVVRDKVIYRMRLIDRKAVRAHTHTYNTHIYTHTFTLRTHMTHNLYPLAHSSPLY